MKVTATNNNELKKDAKEHIILTYKFLNALLENLPTEETSKAIASALEKGHLTEAELVKLHNLTNKLPL